MNEENYFGMYIGQRIYSKDLIQTERILLEVAKDHIHCKLDNILLNTRIDTIRNDVKLILRPFEDMTAKELQAFDKVSKSNLEVLTGKAIGHFISYSPLETEYLISIGIDIFNLKDRDMAVYESDLKGETK